ncbi:MAG: hypothetical protein AB7G17_11485 [Phycisphaerales bacterium]
MARSRREPLFVLDPGWLFLLAGMALLSATVLIPAFDQLSEAELQRARAQVTEARATKRLSNHAQYRSALSRGDETLSVALVATHLGLAPADRTVLTVPGEVAGEDLSPWPGLEPPAAPVLYRVQPDTVLQRWATGDRSRVYLLAAGSMFILLGLLPPTIRSRAPGEA